MSSLFNIAAGGQAGFYDYEIENSLRFDDGNNTTLNDTMGTPTNTDIATISVWVKRANLSGVNQAIIGGYDGSSGTSSAIYFNASNQLHVAFGGGSGALVTSAFFRDVSAWYNIHVVFDSTQSTSSDRCKIYINGQQITDFASSSYPSQNQNTHMFSSGSNHRIGSNWNNTGNRFDGYMADFNGIDGTALDPSSFGETKSGVWIPKDTSGLTFGNNGFRLEFGDSSAIGDDTSGNGNDWTANNLSAHDVVPDSPTLNYSTLNSLTLFASNTDLAEGNLKASGVNKGAGSNWGSLFSTFNLPSTGKYYVEAMAFIVAGSGNTGGLAVVDTAVYPSTGRQSTIWYNFTTGEGYDGLYLSLFNNNAQPFSDGVGGTTEGSITGTTSVGMLAVDIDNGKVWAGYDGNWLASGDPAAGTNEIATRTFTETDAILIGTSYNGTNDQGMWANFGQDSTFGGTLTAGGYSDANGYGDFKYAVPSGFLALNSANLPEPSITPLDDDVPEDYFNTVTYAGNNTAGHSITGVGFSSDFTWIKNRSSSTNHILTDTVRGATETLFSDSSSQELTVAGGLTSFDSDGFTVGYDSTAIVNATSNNYVAWNWLAGGTAVSNTDGSITSSVSANTKAGFSIVSYTGNGTAGATIGHGLDKAPELLINKNRDEAQVFQVNADVIGKSYVMSFTTAARLSRPNQYYYNWDSSVITTGSDVHSNGNADKIIAYCFHSVEGYSKIGSYSGNSSNDGTFVYTGFRPAIVLTKVSSGGTGGWIIQDTTRSVNNLMNDYLLANTNGNEQTGVNIDLLSNGFKWRAASTSTTINHNASGDDYIYMAFAEMPFKYANAR